MSGPQQVLKPGTESGLYRWYVVVLLALIFAVQYLDRQIVVVLSEPIKAEFQLSDSQMGLISGFVFSIPYCLAIVPVGMLVDRLSRRNLLLLALISWSVLTALTGFTRQLWQLMLTRAAIATVESTSQPAATAMIADLFGPRSRATAIGIYYSGPALATFIGFPLLAHVAIEYSWRIAFFAGGVPGLILGILLVVTIREPRRSANPNKDRVSGKFWENLAFVWRQRSMVHLIAAMTVTAIINFGQIAWMAPMMMRAHGLSLTEAAYVISLAFGLTNAAGHLIGGAIVDFISRRDMRWQTWGPAIFALVTCCFMLVNTLSPSITMAITGLATWSFISGFQYGPVMGSVQTLAPPRMRGFAAACLVLLVNLIGAGGGPLIAGVLSDGLGGSADGHSLRWSLSILAVLHLWAAMHFVLAGRTLLSDTDRAGDALH